MNATQRQEVWHERAASVGSLIVAVLVMIGGTVGSVVGLAMSYEQREGFQDRQISNIETKLQYVIEENRQQTERMNRREAENRAAQEQEMRLLLDINKQLAVHEALGGIGLKLKPMTK